MSYILDALKKTELEKNRRKQPAGRIDLTVDVFQGRSKPVARSGTWKTVTMIVVVALVASAGTWFALRGNGKKNPISARVTNQTRQVKPLAPVAATAQEISAPKPPQHISTTPTPLPAPMPLASKSTAEAGAHASPLRGRRRMPKQSVVEQLPQKPPAPLVSQAPADIKLSGIAWQDERSGRRAVINGFLLKEGAIVSGATITDIQAGKVRFSGPGGVFEIKLDAVVPSEAK